MGKYTNWCQVFGRNAALWFIPIMGRSGKPDGSGISWPTKKGTNYEEMAESEGMVKSLINIV